MSQQNVELVRRSLEGLNAAAWNPSDEGVLLHPEGSMYPPAEWPGADVYEGHEGRAALIREWTSSFQDLRAEIERLIDDGDRVIALVRMRGTSKASGVDIDWQLGFIASDFADDDGRAREVRWYMSQEQALEAAGIEPPGA